MNKKQVIQALEEAKKNSPKRKFSQTVDLIINLKQINLKKPEEKVDFFVSLPHGKGKKAKVCAFVDNALVKDAEANCDKVILNSDFSKLKSELRTFKKIVREYDFFIAQANLMPDIAKNFGRYLGTKGKMPNPKAGCIVAPKGETKPVCEMLQNLIRVITKADTIIKCPLGTEDMTSEQIADNFMIVYNQLVNTLPQHEQNINSILLKLTMGKPVKVRETTK
ncbi:MAG: 50S ribosomal protein L1 [archaeon]